MKQKIIYLAFAMLCSQPALALASEEGATSHLTVAHGLIALASALGMGLAIIGGAYGQSKMAAAAFEGTARNPEAKVMGVLLLSMALVESLVLLAFVCMNALVGKI